MDHLAGAIGWLLHGFSEFFAPSGWTLRRALVLLLVFAVIAGALFVIAWPDGLPD